MPRGGKPTRACRGQPGVKAVAAEPSRPALPAPRAAGTANLTPARTGSRASDEQRSPTMLANDEADPRHGTGGQNRNRGKHGNADRFCRERGNAGLSHAMIPAMKPQKTNNDLCAVCGRPPAGAERIDRRRGGYLAECICEPRKTQEHVHAATPLRSLGTTPAPRCGAPEGAVLGSGEAVSCPTCRDELGLDPYGRMDTMAAPAR